MMFGGQQMASAWLIGNAILGSGAKACDIWLENLNLGGTKSLS